MGSDPAVHPDNPAKKLADGLHDLLVLYDATENCINMEGDYYNGNTGLIGGTNADLERMQSGKCHRSVCLCKTIELPLRHLIEHLDGKTSS